MLNLEYSPQCEIFSLSLRETCTLSHLYQRISILTSCPSLVGTVLEFNLQRTKIRGIQNKGYSRIKCQISNQLVYGIKKILLGTNMDNSTVLKFISEEGERLYEVNPIV